MTNEPLTPLPSDVVDELLSAEIDGELAAAAVDLGLDPDTVHARLAATPGTDARRAALARARDLGGELVGLDDATTARLVAAALPHAPVDEMTARRNSRRGRVLAAVGVAAAIAVVFMAVSITGGSDSDNDSSQVASRSPNADEDAGAGVTSKESAASADLFSPDLGEVSDPVVLRERLASVSLQYAAGDDMAAFDSSRGVSVPSEATESEDGAGSPEASLPATGVLPPTPDDARLSDDCLAAKTQEYGIDAAPTLIATATYDGEPVTVLVYDVEQGRQIFVIAPDGCTVRLAQLDPP